MFQDKKKKKIKEEKDSSDEKEKDNWRIEMLQKMKSIKNLPPEQLEIEFHKTMAEKKRKEEEEKCLEMIKERQKLARKVGLFIYCYQIVATRTIIFFSTCNSN